MARTNRKYRTDGNHREARKGRATVRRANAAVDALYAALPTTASAYEATLAVEAAHGLAPWGRRTKRGGMLRSPGASGRWRDEAPKGTERTRERRRWLAEADDAVSGS